MTQKHKWEWAKGERTGVKRCARCGMVKYPGHVFEKARFFMGLKLMGEGKTPPCKAQKGTKQ